MKVMAAGPVDVAYGTFSVFAVVSIIFAVRALLLFRDSNYVSSMLFLKSKDIAKLVSILFWGTSLPLAMAMAFTLINLAFPLALFEYISLIMFVIFFAMMNYVIVRGSLLVGGSK